MPELALACWLVFGLFALAGRAVLQRVRTGSWGVRGLSGEPGSLEWVAGLLFVAAIAAVIAAPVLDLLEVSDPVGALDGDAAHLAGGALFAAGFTITVGAQLAMGASWRVGIDNRERTELVTGGPFAIVRNPIYSGMLPAVAGIALIDPTAVAIAGWACLLVALELQVRIVEEPHLLRVHGDAYAEYASRVGRFVPGLGLLRGGRA